MSSVRENKQVEFGKEPTIFYIIELPDNNVFKYLVNKGVKLQSKMRADVSAPEYTVPEYIGLCCSWGPVQKKEAYDMLREKGIKLEPCNEMASLGNEDELKIMIRERKSSLLEQTDGQFNNVFHYAAANGQLDVLMMLNEEFPGMLSTKNCVGVTPLLLAAYNGHIKTVEWLLKNGASILEADVYGNKAHHLAAYNGKTEVVKCLYNKHAAPGKASGKDKRYYAPLHYAAFRGKGETLQWLIETGGKEALAEKDNQGNSAAMLAAKGGHLEIIRYLVEKHKGCLEEKNYDGENAYDIAKKYGHHEVAGFIAAYAKRTNSVLSSTPSGFIRRIGGESGSSADKQLHESPIASGVSPIRAKL